jgi:hypothetical protein
VFGYIYLVKNDIRDGLFASSGEWLFFSDIIRSPVVVLIKLSPTLINNIEYIMVP